MGVSRGRAGLESRYRGQTEVAGTKVENRQGFQWPASSDREGGRTPASVLLQQPHPGARPSDPVLDNRRALDPGPNSLTKTGKDVAGQTGKHVVRLDTRVVRE